MNCTVEGDGRQWPELLLADERVQREKALPSLLLAKAMGLISTVQNPATGAEDLYLLARDEDGLPIRTRLGQSLAEVSEAIDLSAAQKLEDAATAQLQQEAWQHKDKRDQLRQLVLAELEAVQHLCGGNFEDPLYKRFELAARAAIQRMKNR